MKRPPLLWYFWGPSGRQLGRTSSSLFPSSARRLILGLWICGLGCAACGTACDPSTPVGCFWESLEVNKWVKAQAEEQRENLAAGKTKD